MQNHFGRRAVAPLLTAATLTGLLLVSTLPLAGCRGGTAKPAEPTAASGVTAGSKNAGAPTTDFLNKKAQESGGDLTKLSPADQAQVQQLTRGNGAMVLRGLAGK